MTHDEVLGYIVKHWMSGDTIDRIMVSLICLGRPMGRRDILAVVKRYCDIQSENREYIAKAKR